MPTCKVQLSMNRYTYPVLTTIHFVYYTNLHKLPLCTELLIYILENFANLTVIKLSLVMSNKLISVYM